MPTYQYACTECEHRLEAVQSFSEDALSVCPECSGKLRKLFGSVGIVFKGSGFYRTDSRAGGGSSTVSASESSSGGKSESKSSESKSSSTSSSSDSGSSSTSSSSSSSSSGSKAAAAS